MSSFPKPEPVQIDHLVGNPYQPRLAIDTARLAPLIESIRQHGFLGHLEARRDPVHPAGPLQLVYGHRRLKAAELARLRTVPVAIVERTDEEMRRIAFIENDTVEELTYWEQGTYLKRLKAETGWTIEEMAKQLNKSKGWVQNRLDVLRLPEGSPLRAAAQADQITMTAALALLNLEPAEQGGLFDRLQRGEINADDLKALRTARARPVPSAAPTLATPADHPKRPSTASEHARWVLRHVEASLRLVRRHAKEADFAALSAPDRERLAACRAELLELLDPART